MTKAYDIKALGQKIIEKAKARGLTLAEETAEALAIALYEAHKEWFQESAALSTNKFDDVLALYVDSLDPIVLPQIEKIDLDGNGK